MKQFAKKQQSSKAVKRSSKATKQQREAKKQQRNKEAKNAANI